MQRSPLSDIARISLVAAPTRVTGPLLDVLEVFLEACRDGRDLHGWTIMKATKRSGPTVYGVLDRLEDAGWISGWWEEQHPEPGRPRRRFYRLTPNGTAAARQLLTARRPAAHRPPGTVPGLLLAWLRTSVGGMQ
jgi:PadR family transcriptional regulator, regulatory protein PadR